jgi:predicted dinucleotide-binding enzyme
MPNFDAIIICTGQSGPALAGRLVAAGWKVENVRFTPKSGHGSVGL